MDETIRILLLEDNPADADMIEYELKEAGINFKLKRVITEKNFITAIKEYLPHIILSDYDLPQYNGAWALAETKTICPDIPFILVTGALSEERAIEMLTSGAKDYVMKKHLHRLAPAVLRVLEEAREIKARQTAQVELMEAYRTLESNVKKRTARLQAEIKERKKNEKSLRESQIITNALLNSAIESILMFGLNGDVLAANHTAAEQLGLGGSKAVAKKWADFLPKDLASQYERMIEEVIKTGMPVNFENEQAGKIFHHNFYPALDIKGKIIGVTCLSHDITESRKAEQEIRYLASFSTLNPNPIVEMDRTGQISYINPAAEQLFPDLRNTGANHPLLAGWVEILRSFQKGEETQCHREVQIKKGQWFFLTFSFVAGSRSIRVYGFDITESKQKQDDIMDKEVVGIGSQ